MKYDRDEWHSNGNFPDGVPPENGGTHIGMFLAWAIIHGLAGPDHHRRSKSELDAVQARQMTGREFLRRRCSGKFWSCDLNDEGNAFARGYYGEGGKAGEYFDDYFYVLGSEGGSFYHVEDTWENYDVIAEEIDYAYEQCREKRAG